MDNVSEVAAEAAPYAATSTPLLAVQFQGGESAFLDPSLPQSAVWADVLQSLREAGQPAYVEVDPESRVITRLLLPRALTVESITPTEAGDGVEVELVISHARHFLRRDHRDYDRLLRALEGARKKKATVLVTDDLETQQIIDVRALPKQKRGRRR